MNDKAYMDRLLNSPEFADVIGGDMEAWGLYQAVVDACSKLEKYYPWIVVKGICDWGFDKIGDWQVLAATAASDLVFKVLSAPNAIHRVEMREVRNIYCHPKKWGAPCHPLTKNICIIYIALNSSKAVFFRYNKILKCPCSYKLKV